MLKMEAIYKNINNMLKGDERFLANLYFTYS